MALENCLTWPVTILQVVGAAAVMVLLHGNSYDWKNENYKSLVNLKWYVAHIFLCLGHQLLWGSPLVKAAQRRPGSRLPVVLYLTSALLSGVVTAVPLIRLSKQQTLLGFAVYLSSVAYILLFLFGLGYLLIRFSEVAQPKDQYSAILLRLYVAKLEGFHWLSGYQLAAYWPRALLSNMAWLNGLFSWFLLAWHLFLAAYVGSHKPRWDAAHGVKRD